MKTRTSIVCAVFLILAFSATALAQGAIRFGVPPWPGVTVKTEVVAQILEAMGYETEQLEVGPPIIYKSFSSDDLDAYVAAWIPGQRSMFEPVRDAGELEVVATNLDEAVTGLAVPPYVYEAGVRSIADLDAHADRFEHTLYTIETGAGMTTSTEEMIAGDVAGLGDWNMVSATTPVMLSAVQERIKDGKWVVFHAWKPHWMVIEIEMRFLEGVPGSEKLTAESMVHTVVNEDFSGRYPEAYKFLKTFKIDAETQSRWIYEFGFKEREPEDVARQWIAENMDTVSGWLQGVRTTDGKPAAQAVRAAVQ
jgi:glycine betaine/proline transport system substrate-binding protein